MASWCLLPGTAEADQCAWVTKMQAEAAQSKLKLVDGYLDYCELCDGAQPSWIKINSVTNKAVDQGMFEVSINGTPIDLAYAFIPVGGTRYDNLSKLVSCPSEGVSPSLEYSKDRGLQRPKDRWSGHFARANIAWFITKQHAGPSYDLRLELLGGDRSASFNNKGVEPNGEALVFSVPFPDCQLMLKSDSASISVSPSGRCGSFGEFSTGRFERAR